MATGRCLALMRRLPRRYCKLANYSIRRNYEVLPGASVTYNEYRHPLITRYASPRMRSIWSEQEKFTTWRKLWVALAKSQYELGLKGITKEQIDLLAQNVSTIDFQYAEQEEKKLRHDVMAHVHTFGHQCPESDGIIHLGATSCFVQDNGDLYQMKNAGNVLQSKLLKLIQALRNLSLEYADLPALGYTHFQAAQLTTYCTLLFYSDALNVLPCLKSFTCFTLVH